MDDARLQELFAEQKRALDERIDRVMGVFRDSLDEANRLTAESEQHRIAADTREAAAQARGEERTVAALDLRRREVEAYERIAGALERLARREDSK